MKEERGYSGDSLDDAVLEGEEVLQTESRDPVAVENDGREVLLRIIDEILRN